MDWRKLERLLNLVKDKKEPFESKSQKQLCKAVIIDITAFLFSILKLCNLEIDIL